MGSEIIPIVFGELHSPPAIELPKIIIDAGEHAWRQAGVLHQYPLTGIRDPRMRPRYVNFEYEMRLYWPDVSSVTIAGYIEQLGSVAWRLQ